MTPPADFIALLEWITGKPMTKADRAIVNKLLPVPPPDPRPWEIVLVE